ncbi:MAG TPA: alkaline phosphatase [Candidatus Krumholzibacteria bacterium]|nr:alkaline phosphatase [Candidatus Krumholzibacteria bacterium]
MRLQHLALVLGSLVTAVGSAWAQSQSQSQPANVIFVHPDGAALNSWNAARTYWKGPDGRLAWDLMPEMLVYRGHMSDRLGATSNGGATAHAFGQRVKGGGSFGRDGSREESVEITAASGYHGSVLREAANTGHPVGLVNDGDLPEPGTGVYWAEASHRDEANEIARQFVDGRPGFEDVDVRPVVALGGGEAFFLPDDAPPCGDRITPDCYLHVDPLSGDRAAREDGRNLVRELLGDGWVVLRTRAGFEDFARRLRAEPGWTPRVLGLFAAEDVFNDTTEERMVAAGLVRDEPSRLDPRAGRLITHGSPPGTPGYDPPRAEEMHDVALEVLRRHAEAAGKPFLLVSEVESTDNFGNKNNALGTLVGLRSADRVIDASLRFVRRNPRTFVLTAADSDGSSLQVVSPPRSTVRVNPTGRSEDDVRVPTDGMLGRDTAPFVASADDSGREMEFTVAWIGTVDVHGGILSRLAGWRAEEVHGRYASRFTNTDVYAVTRAILFGESLGAGTR